MNASNSQKHSPSPPRVPYSVGDCVEVSKSRVALIKYFGPLRGVRGEWYGIEFVDGSVGSHNGRFRDVLYFVGSDKRCEFIAASEIRRHISFKSNSTRNFHSQRGSGRIHHNANEPTAVLPLDALMET